MVASINCPVTRRSSKCLESAHAGPEPDWQKATRYRTSPSRRLLDGWLSRRGLRLNVLLEADDHLVLRALIKEGIGFSLLTQGAFLSELGHGELQAWPFRPRAYWDLALVAAGDERRTELVGALAALIRETVREQVLNRAWPGVLLDS